MYIKRNLEDKLLQYLNSPEIIAVIGPRQSGKTTLLKQIYANYKEQGVFISFDDPDILSLFEHKIEDFARLYVIGRKGLFIDEFQYAKNGGRSLKYIYDKYKIKIFITGSSSIDLTVKSLKYLVGRIFIFELLPFDFSEFLKAKDGNLDRIYTESLNVSLESFYKGKAKPSISGKIEDKIRYFFKEYLVYGGYPRAVLAESFEEKKEVLKNIYSTFLLREVKDYMGLIDDYKLQNLVKALSLQIGSLAGYNDLSLLSGYSFVSLKKYLNFLEKSYICLLVRPFFKNRRSEFTKKPKVYFLDTGLRNCIYNDFRSIEERADAGSLLENGIFAELRKKNITPQYWHNKNSGEVDFIIQQEGVKLALEIKLTLEKCKDSPAVRMFKEKYPDFSFFYLYLEKRKENQSRADINALPAYVI